MKRKEKGRIGKGRHRKREREGRERGDRGERTGREEKERATEKEIEVKLIESTEEEE